MSVSTLLQDVAQYIDENIPLRKDVPILVGVSGGADSVALLHILMSLKYNCIVCHCNFGLRGEESERDHRFVIDMASRYKLPFTDVCFETEAYASREKVSIEMACRTLRYTWFEEKRIEYNAQYIAVAHHKDDSAETFLLNLIRGTGIAGLTGIAAVNGKIIRPLLSVSRAQVEEYLALNSIEYITDSTNLQDVYTRNKVRLNVIPELQQVNSKVIQSIMLTASHLQDVETVYRWAMEEQKKAVVSEFDGEQRICIDKLMKLPSPSAFLFELLYPLGFVPAQIDEILNAVDAPSGKQFLSRTHLLIKDRTELIVAPQNNADTTFPILIPEDCTGIDRPVKMRFTKHDAKEYKIKRDKNVACLDAQKIKYPLSLRRWKEGDTFVPLGMKGRKKLSNYFNDCKYSLLDKQNALLLCSGDEIVWLVKERISQKYSVNADTVYILEIYCE